MNTIAALALVSLLAGPSGSSRAAVTRGNTTASVDVKGKRAKVSVRSGRSNAVITLHTANECTTKKLAQVLAREVAENASAFRGLPSRASIRLPGNATALRNLERGLAEILASGRHVGGKREGATRFEGFTVPLGRLPGAGKTKTVERPRGGRGSTTTVFGLPGGGAKVTRETRGRSGVADVTEITLTGDGSGSFSRAISFGSGAMGVTITEGGDFDGKGNDRGGFAKVHTGGGVVFDEGSGESGGGDSEPTPSGGDDGGGDDQNEQNGNEQSSGGGKPAAAGRGGQGPSMTSDGTLTMPGMSFGDATTAAVINWNRLGAAVTTPDPTGGDDSTIDEGQRGHGPGGPTKGCGGLDRAGFNPDPKFLRPNKGRWVTDPVPALRGTERRGNRRR